MNKPTQAQNMPVVLVIEDDPILTKMYKEKFTNEGFEVLTAPDGESGLETAVNKKIDIILLDVMLPRMSGIELLKRLREHEKGKNMYSINN